MKLSDYVSGILAHFFQLLLIISTVYTFFIGEYVWAIAGLFSLTLTILPGILRNKYGVILPWDLDLLLVVAVYLSVGGGVMGWYDAYPEFDKITHFFSSLTVAIFAFVAVVIIHYYTEINLNRVMIIVLMITFTLAIGSLWELTEFFYDQLTGSNWQPSVFDTMMDLIYDILGGVVGAYFADLYLQNMPEKHFQKTFTLNQINLEPIKKPMRKIKNKIQQKIVKSIKQKK